MSWKYHGKIIDETEIYDIIRENYTTEEFDYLIDSCHDLIEIGTLTFNPSRILKELDKIAYDIAFNEECEHMTNEIIYNCHDKDIYGFGIEYIDEE